MLEVPSTPWRGETWARSEALTHAPIDATWRKRTGEVTHTFTHFHLVLDVFAADIADHAAEGEWADPANLKELALPTVMKKIIALGLRA